MINPPWLDLHPSHLAQCRQTTTRKIFMKFEPNRFAPIPRATTGSRKNRLPFSTVRYTGRFKNLWR